MKTIFKYSLLGSLIFLFIGSVNSSWVAEKIGMSCKEKFRKKNQDLTPIMFDKNFDGIGVDYKILKGTVVFNNEPKKKCIARIYKKNNGEKGYQTVCGTHIFRNIGNAYNFKNYKSRHYMSFEKVVDKNGNEFPLNLVSYKTKITCEDNYKPGLVRQLSSQKIKYKVQSNPSRDGSTVKPIYLEDRFYLKQLEVERIYRLPITPNF